MTPTARYANNLKALALLAELIPQQSITDEQRATLQAYEGWADNRVRTIGFDGNGVPIAELTQALATLGVTPDTLINAQGLSAYFTPHTVAAAVWDLGLNALGRIPRAVLEPSAGMGHFLSEAGPHADTQCLAVEPDPIYSRILKHLYSEPNGPWTIRATTLERAGLVEPAFDLIVGNVPFGDWGVADSHCVSELRHKYLQNKVHDYFICKAVSLLLPGGVCALITHRSTLDRDATGVREWVSARAELIGAWRLPAEMWESQGAGPIADVLVLRRKG